MTDLRELIGKPWAVPCDPPNTYDCWELVQHVRKLYDIDTPSVVDRMLRKPMNRILFTDTPEGWSELLRPIPLCVARIGSNHVGVVLPLGDVIHSSVNTGVRIDRLSLMDEKVTFWEYTHA